MSSLADSDAPGACAQLGPAARQDLARYMQQAFPEVDDRDCAQSIRTAFSLSDPAMLTALRDIDVQVVEESGDSASVQLGEGGQIVQVQRTDGRWKIAQLSFGG